MSKTTSRPANPTTSKTSPSIINQKTVCSAPIELPPIPEQTEIARRVEEVFGFADRIEQRVATAQQRVNRLTQSILAKAFRGELSADWRAQQPELITAENSAQALLQRIQQARQSLAPKPPKRAKKRSGVTPK